MLLSFRCSGYFVQVLFMSRTTVFYCFIKTSAFNVTGNLVSPYLVTLAGIQDTSAREVTRSHLSCILSFDLVGQHQNKRFYVTEIVLPLRFADAIFRRERSDDRKCNCCSQAIHSLVIVISCSLIYAAVGVSGRQKGNKFLVIDGLFIGPFNITAVSQK